MSFMDQPVTALIFGNKRTVNGIAIPVIISEETMDSIQITQHPVQANAMISDHAFKKPIELSMRASFNANILNSGGSINSNNTLSNKYEQLLNLQSSFQYFTIVTPKRTYNQMMFIALSVVTDKFTENVLMVYMRFQQIILVPVSPTTLNPALLKNAPVNAGIQNRGAQQVGSTLNQITGITAPVGE